MNYRQVSGVIFTVVAVAHAVRAALGVPVHIGSQSLGLSVSWIAGAIAAALAFWAFRGE